MKFYQGQSAGWFHLSSLTLAKSVIFFSPLLSAYEARAQGLSPVTEVDFGLKIVQFDVGQADAAALLTPDGKCSLIDLGRKNAHGEMVAEFLQDESQNGVQSYESIDFLFVTHYDVDHIGGAQKLGEALTVKAAYDQGPSQSRPVITPTGRISSYGKYVAFVGDPDGDGNQDDGEADFVRNRAEYGDTFQLGNAELTILSVRGDTRGVEHDIDRDPSRADREEFDENPGSIAMLVRLGEFEFLTAGDATCRDWAGKPDTETSLISSAAIPNGHDIDVLKINHHGSDTSSGERYILATRPEVGIISSTVQSPHYIPKKTSVMMLDRIEALALVTGAATDHEGNYVESSSTGDDGYDIRAETVQDNQGHIVILVSTDGSRYTVRTTPAVGPPREWTFSSSDADNPHPMPLEAIVMTAPAADTAAAPGAEGLMAAAPFAGGKLPDLETQEKVVVELRTPEAEATAADIVAKALKEHIAAAGSKLSTDAGAADVRAAQDAVISVKFPDKLVIEIRTPGEESEDSDAGVLVSIERLGKVFLWPLVAVAIALILKRELFIFLRRRKRA